MNKAELVAAVAEASGLAKKDADRAVTATLEVIERALGRGDRVSIAGFGTFEVRERAARVGRNPKTGEEIRIAATKVPSFKAGKALKETVGR